MVVWVIRVEVEVFGVSILFMTIVGLGIYFGLFCEYEYVIMEIYMKILFIEIFILFV